MLAVSIDASACESRLWFGNTSKARQGPSVFDLPTWLSAGLTVSVEELYVEGINE